MNKENDCALIEWEFARKNTIEFINYLSEEELDLELPRKGLNTFRKHFQEMLAVQEAYIDGIKTGKMEFNIADDKYYSINSKEELIKKLTIIDIEMKNVIANKKFNYEVIWGDGEFKTIASHMCALTTHEIFHIGQLVAFLFVLKLPIPEHLADVWILPKL